MMNKNEWKKVKLEDVFELQIGRTPSRNNKNYWDNGSNNWISISDIKENEKYIEKTKERITNLAIQDSKIKLVPKNTVIMSFKLSVGKTAITSQDIYTNEAIVAFIPKVLNLVDNNFLYYYLQNINWKDGINKAVKGLTLNKPLISNKIIFLPDLKIQKQIAKKLDTVFSILNLKKQQLLELDKLVKFQFLEIFGLPNLNEKNWKTEKLENIYKIIDGDRGKNYPKQNEFYKNEFCLFLNAKNVTNFGFNFDKVEFITKEKDEILRSGKLERGDIVVTTRGTIGNTAYYDNNITFENIRINSGMVILREKEKMNPIFFIKYFQNFRIYNKVVSGTAQPQIPITNMKNLKIIVPPIELQNKFADFVKQVDKSKVELQKSIDETQLLFDSLMDKYFG